MRIAFLIVLAVLPMGAALLLAGLLSGPAGAWPWPNPGDKVTMTVDKVGCGSGRAAVRLHNQTRQPVRFDLKADGASLASGSIPARTTVVRNVPVDKGSRAEIAAFSISRHHPDKLIDSTRVENDCPWGHHRGRLPYTGPPADLMGKLATAVGLVITGGILWWYGSIWPRSSM